MKLKASENQIGGEHYKKMAIQPTEFSHKNNLGFIQGNIVKYICRYKFKNGIEDIKQPLKGSRISFILLTDHGKARA